MRNVIFALLLAVVCGGVANAQDRICRTFEGAIIINDDGEYIGKIARKSDPDSIFNQYGQFGSKYRSGSIWNEYGKNGNKLRSGSVFHPRATDSPVIIKNREIIGYLNTNKSRSDVVNPIELGARCYDFVSPR